MSGLAALLAGRQQPGVFRWHAAFEASDVAHAVEHAGWRFALLDAWPTDSKVDFLERIGAALALPEHYGRNLDALADCLADLPSERVEGTVVLWEGWGPFAHADERGFSGALQVLRERAEAPDEAPFAVLLRGDGPDLPAVSSLD
jgi:RNAse (barnase) inhibitor barstar